VRRILSRDKKLSAEEGGPSLREEELQRLIDAIPDALWSAEVAADGALAYRYCSPAVLRITGLSPEHLMASSKRWLGTIIDPLDRAAHAEAWQRITSGATNSEQAQYRIRRADGTLRWLHDSMRATRLHDGRLLLDGVASDITEAKRAEEALRESEARFRGLTELSSDWYWRQDETLRFTYLSNQALDLTGHTGHSSYGKTRWELANMVPLTTTWPEHQAVLAARQPFRDLECRRIGADGKARYLSMSGAPIFDEHGRFRGYHGIGRNITESKRIEEELRARQDLLDLAQGAARAVAFHWPIGHSDEDTLLSAELDVIHQRVPGLPRSESENRAPLVHPDDWPGLRDAIQSARQSGDVAAAYRVLLPDGAVRWLEAKGRTLFDDDAKPIAMVGFLFDVSQRHEAEEELHRLEWRLRQAQRLEAMGTLAGGIAHDFNNVLGVILGYGEMALREAAPGSRLHRDLGSIMTAGERGRALVEQILAFSRSSVNEQVAVHLERVTREALDHLAAKMPVDVTIVPQLRAGKAALLGDPTQVHQVVMNLVTNAAQAMPSGGLVRVRLEPLRLEVARAVTTGAIAGGDYVLLEVADAGVGMAPEIIDRIFDPFFTTKEVGVGTGLGLSLVHGIVTELGGAINVASTPGAGSVISVYLPRAGDATEAEEDEAPEAPRGHGQRVLIVDDEPALVRIASETLEQFGYRTFGFTSSGAALQAFRDDPLGFDAVLTDERMPGMTGSALIREIRGLRAGIPTLLMSGYTGGAADNVAPQWAADEVLKKPLPARELVAGVARVLERARTSEGLPLAP
jgi:PAS domain S-box-containing protein